MFCGFPSFVLLNNRWLSPGNLLISFLITTFNETSRPSKRNLKPQRGHRGHLNNLPWWCPADREAARHPQSTREEVAILISQNWSHLASRNELCTHPPQPPSKPALPGWSPCGLRSPFLTFWQLGCGSVSSLLHSYILTPLFYTRETSI